MRALIFIGLIVLAALMLTPGSRLEAQQDTTSSPPTESSDSKSRLTAKRQDAVHPVPGGLAEYRVVLEGLPKSIEKSGGGWLTSAAVAAIIGALITAVVALLRISKEAEIQKRNEKLQSDAQQSQKEFEEAKLTMEHKFQAWMQEISSKHKAVEAEKIRTHERKIHGDRVEHMRKQLMQASESSEAELELKVDQLVSERRLEEARILDRYFSRLLSERNEERELALFALSNVVDSEVLEQIAASRSVGNMQRFLSKLASRGTEHVRDDTQKILNKAVSDLQPSVVQVSITESYASGFLCMKNNLILSALLPVKTSDEVKITYRTKSGEESLNATVLFVNKDSQLMAAKLESRLPTEPEPLTLLQSGAISDLLNSDLTALQWPRGKDFIARTGQVTETNAKLSGRDTDYISEDGSARPGYIKIQVETESGATGTPLVTDSGKVAGMLVTSARDHCYAIGADTLDEFIQSVINGTYPITASYQ